MQAASFHTCAKFLFSLSRLQRAGWSSVTKGVLAQRPSFMVLWPRVQHSHIETSHISKPNRTETLIWIQRSYSVQANFSSQCKSIMPLHLLLSINTAPDIGVSWVFWFNLAFILINYETANTYNCNSSPDIQITVTTLYHSGFKWHNISWQKSAVKLSNFLFPLFMTVPGCIKNVPLCLTKIN